MRNTTVFAVCFAVLVATAPVPAQYPAVIDPAPAAPAAPETSAAGNLPAWLQPGMRAIWWGGSRSVPGAAQSYVPDPQGNFTINGRTYRLEDNEGSAGFGFTQYDVVHVGKEAIGLAMSNFVPADAQLRQLTLTHRQGCQGDHGQIADIWMHPTRLAAMVEERTATSLVRRMSYPLDGRDYNAIVVQVTGQDGFFRHVYDLETGLMLAYASVTTGKGGLTPLSGTTAGQGAGVTTFVNSRFVGVRDTRLPWAKQAGLPDWLRPGKQMAYSGTYENSLGKGIVAPWRYDVNVAVQRVFGGFAVAELSSRLDYGYGEPQISRVQMVYGAGTTGPLWIQPEVLAKLQPGQTYDQDSTTGRVVRCSGADQMAVSIVEEGPLDGSQFTYDRQSGVLVAVALRMQQGPAVLTTNVQLVR